MRTEAEQALREYAEGGDLEFYSKYDDVWGTIQEILGNDIRSKNMREVCVCACCKYIHKRVRMYNFLWEGFRKCAKHILVYVDY